MTVKTLLYIVMIPLSVWALDSINIKNVFKKNRIYQARLLYLFLSLGLSYLVVNCLFDFFMYTQIV